MNDSYASRHYLSQKICYMKFVPSSFHNWRKYLYKIFLFFEGLEILKVNMKYANSKFSRNVKWLQ